MPDTYLRNKDAAKISKQMAEADPITHRPKNEGLKFTNDTSPNNPFNTISQAEYKAWEDYNKSLPHGMTFKEQSQLQQGGLKEGNHISKENPFGYTTYGYLSHHDVENRDRLQKFRTNVLNNPNFQTQNAQNTGMSTGLGVGPQNLDIPGVTTQHNAAPAPQYDGSQMSPEQLQASLAAQQQQQGNQLPNQVHFSQPNNGIAANPNMRNAAAPTQQTSQGQNTLPNAQGGENAQSHLLDYSTFNPPRQAFPKDLNAYTLPQMESGFYNDNRLKPYGPSIYQDRASGDNTREPYSFIAQPHYA